MLGCLLTFDVSSSTTQVFYSSGTDALKSVTDVIANDVSGRGQFHFGVLKKGVNGGADITKDAEQPANINEGIVFGGIFQEDSAAVAATLSPAAASASIATKRSNVKRSKQGLRYGNRA